MQLEHPHAEGGPAIAGDVASFPHDAEYARTLVAAQRRGHLATLTADGFPFGSVVSYVDDASGRPVVCISAMAEHTINVKRVGADEYASRSPDPIAPSAEAIRTHLDEDHADVLLDYAKAYAGLTDATSARTAGVDRYGVTLWVTTPSGGRTARIAFDEPATTVDDVRTATVTLAQRARLRSPG